MPGIDARLLITPQHAVDALGDLLRVGGRVAQQLAEDLPHLLGRQRRGFFPPAAAAPPPGTTAPAAPASCGGASRPSRAPRSLPTRPRPCPRAGLLRSGAARRGRAP